MTKRVLCISPQFFLCHLCIHEVCYERKDVDKTVFEKRKTMREKLQNAPSSSRVYIPCTARLDVELEISTTTQLKCRGRHHALMSRKRQVYLAQRRLLYATTEFFRNYQLLDIFDAWYRHRGVHFNGNRKSHCLYGRNAILQLGAKTRQHALLMCPALATFWPNPILSQPLTYYKCGESLRVDLKVIP
jgi:hypothetical protein